MIEEHATLFAGASLLGLMLQLLPLPRHIIIAMRFCSVRFCSVCCCCPAPCGRKHAPRSHSKDAQGEVYTREKMSRKSKNLKQYFVHFSKICSTFYKTYLLLLLLNFTTFFTPTISLLLFHYYYFTTPFILLLLYHYYFNKCCLNINYKY